MLHLADPHGGRLVERIVAEDEARALRERAARLPGIPLDGRELADLDLIASGAASPLTGFMGLRDYRSVLARLRLADGTPWPVPFTLSVTIEQMASALREGAAALLDRRGALRGVLTVTDAFVRRTAEEAEALYGSADPAHRGARYLLSRPSGVLGGPVTALPLPPDEAAQLPMSPREVRAMARRVAWHGLAGVATPEGVGCLEPIGGAGRALLAAPRVAVRGARGRDALLQAIVLKNHGAREVFLEYERGDWLAVSSRYELEDLGVTPVWLVSGAPSSSGWAPARLRRRPLLQEIAS